MIGIYLENGRLVGWIGEFDIRSYRGANRRDGGSAEVDLHSGRRDIPSGSISAEQSFIRLGLRWRHIRLMRDGEELNGEWVLTIHLDQLEYLSRAPFVDLQHVWMS
jgi:hypothetical protein